MNLLPGHHDIKVFAAGDVVHYEMSYSAGQPLELVDLRGAVGELAILRLSTNQAVRSYTTLNGGMTLGAAEPNIVAHLSELESLPPDLRYVCWLTMAGDRFPLLTGAFEVLR